MKDPDKDLLNSLALEATDEIERKLKERGFELPDGDKLYEAVVDALESIYPNSDYANYN